MYFASHSYRVYEKKQLTANPYLTNDNYFVNSKSRVQSIYYIAPWSLTHSLTD